MGSVVKSVSRIARRVVGLVLLLIAGAAGACLVAAGVPLVALPGVVGFVVLPSAERQPRRSRGERRERRERASLLRWFRSLPIADLPAEEWEWPVASEPRESPEPAAGAGGPDAGTDPAEPTGEPSGLV